MVYPIGLSPNIERDDVTRAWTVLVSPWRWYQNDGLKSVSLWFSQKFGTPYVYFFCTGRSALTTLLRALHIGTGDEVLLQAFTCMVVPNAIRFVGGVPVYVDVDSSGNCDVKDIERKLSPRTKALIVQHTFGTPADMDAILRFAKKKNITVIEDCAHALGATYKGVQLGSLGDAAIFSFGRDKCISSVFGGAVVVKDASVAAEISRLEKKYAYPSRRWISQQLLHPILTWLALPLYASGIGKGLLVLFQKLHLLSFPVEACEKKGEQPKNYLMRYPNALAVLLIHQLTKLDRYSAMRRQAAHLYRQAFGGNRDITMLSERDGSGYLRFGILVNNPSAVLGYAKRHHVILGNWYHAVVDPEGSDMSQAMYHTGSCGHAEVMAKHIVNLPTRKTQAEVQEISKLVLDSLQNT